MSLGLIIGTILGDGHIDKIGSLACEHSIKQEAYLRWKYDHLSHICVSPPKYTQKGKAIRFRTKALFKDLRQEWYGTGRKALPSSFEDALTPLALAVWYMDDGGKKNSSHKGKTVDYLMDNGMRLAISNFNRKEARRMVDVLKNRFDIISCYKREGKYLRLFIPVSGNNSKKFADLIRPYMPDCMLYKLPSFRENMRGKHGRQVYGHDELGRFIPKPEGAETQQRAAVNC